MANNSPVIGNRNERVLAYMIASAILLSVIAIIAVIAATALGFRDFGSGVWPTVFLLPSIGLPLGFILIIVLLIMSAVRRGRAARDDEK